MTPEGEYLNRQVPDEAGREPLRGPDSPPDARAVVRRHGATREAVRIGTGSRALCRNPASGVACAHRTDERASVHD